MTRSTLRIFLLAPALVAAALASLSACDGRTAASTADVALDVAPPAAGPASGIVVAGGPPDMPMDSLRNADALSATANEADLAARLRDAQLPDKPIPASLARAR